MSWRIMREQERALAGAGLADEVEPLAAVRASDAEDAARGAAESVVLADDGEVVVVSCAEGRPPRTMPEGTGATWRTARRPGRRSAV